MRKLVLRGEVQTRLCPPSLHSLDPLALQNCQAAAYRPESVASSLCRRPKSLEAAHEN